MELKMIAIINFLWPWISIPFILILCVGLVWVIFQVFKSEIKEMEG